MYGKHFANRKIRKKKNFLKTKIANRKEKEIIQAWIFSLKVACMMIY